LPLRFVVSILTFPLLSTASPKRSLPPPLSSPKTKGRESAEQLAFPPRFFCS
jgi:hypothetical protein